VCLRLGTCFGQFNGFLLIFGNAFLLGMFSCLFSFVCVVGAGAGEREREREREKGTKKKNQY